MSFVEFWVPVFFFQCVACSTRAILPRCRRPHHRIAADISRVASPSVVPCLGGLHLDSHRRIRAPNVAISSNRCLTTHVTSVRCISRSGIHRHSFPGIVFLTSLFRVTFHLRHRTPPIRRYCSIYPVFVSSPLALSSNALLRHQSQPIRVFLPRLFAPSPLAFSSNVFPLSTVATHSWVLLFFLPRIFATSPLALSSNAFLRQQSSPILG